jgi:NAD(P)-dependent dehydrogenase (short-subunit alcohol dehydrogenase family)
MSKKLDGRVAVVTGGNSGMGLATARRFAAEGAKVVVTGRRQQELEAAAKEIGGVAIGVRADVTSMADLDRLYAAVKEKHGRVDVLFANAGVAEFVPFGQVNEEHFDKAFNSNVKGLFFSVQKALPLIPDGGSIILTASVASIKGREATSVYRATKAAVRSFARTWTADLKARKIRVNVISPGPIETPMFDSLGGTAEGTRGLKAGMAAMVPLGRLGQPDEIAKAAVFLASDDSSFVTGVELFVDGGMAQICAFRTGRSTGAASGGHGVERAVEGFLAVCFFGVGLSHALQPLTWVEFFVWLRGIGRCGEFLEGLLTLNCGALVVAFHNAWLGLPLVITLLGWGMVVKGTVRLAAPGLGLRIYERITPERAWHFRVAGAFALALSAFSGYLAVSA